MRERFCNDPVCLTAASRLYEARLRKNNLLDFDDLLMYTLALLKKPDCMLPVYEHILVDEFQDTSQIQYDLLLLMRSRCVHGRLTIVGAQAVAFHPPLSC